MYGGPGLNFAKFPSLPNESPERLVKVNIWTGKNGPRSDTKPAPEYFEISEGRNMLIKAMNRQNGKALT